MTTPTTAGEINKIREEFTREYSDYFGETHEELDADRIVEALLEARATLAKVQRQRDALLTAAFDAAEALGMPFGDADTRTLKERAQLRMQELYDFDREREQQQQRADAAERRVEEVLNSQTTPFEFLEYLERNYPPGTVLSDIGWHTPRIWRAALYALRALAAASGDTATTKDMPARGMDILFASEHETRTRELLTDAIAAEVSHLPEVSSLPGRCDDDLWPAVERALVAVALHYRTTATTEGGR